MFPTELGHFAPEELREHERGHPHCDFCNICVYSGDDLFEHMRSLHFTCDVCQRSGSFVHFDNRDTLVAHLRRVWCFCCECGRFKWLVSFRNGECGRSTSLQHCTAAEPATTVGISGSPSGKSTPLIVQGTYTVWQLRRVFTSAG